MIIQRQHVRSQLLLLAFLLLCSAPTLAAVKEYEIKAAILHKLSKFVEWPITTFTNIDAPFILCLIGEDNFGDALTALNNHTVQGRVIKILKLPREVSSYEKCQLLFISHSEEKRLDYILDINTNKHTLTVSDQNHFAQRGGMINLRTVGRRIRFEINITAVTKAGLKIHPQLLNLATIVKENR